MLVIINNNGIGFRNNNFYNYTAYTRIKKHLQFELSKVKEFYRETSIATSVFNDNIFNSIYKLKGLDVTKPINEYIKDVRLLNINYFNFINDHNEGKITETDLGKVIILEEDFDRYKEITNSNYLEFKPLRVVYTSKTDLDMAHPFEKYIFNVDSTDSYLDFISVDVKGMFIQYKYWFDSSLGIGESFASFVYKIPYTNMIGDYLDWAIVNRAIMSGGVVSKIDIDNPHSFIFNIYANDTKKYIESVLKVFTNDREFLIDIFSNIKLIDSDNLFNLIKLEDTISKHKEVDFYRIALLELFHSFAEKNKSSRTINKPLFTTFQREVRNYKLRGGFFRLNEKYIKYKYKLLQDQILEVV